MISPYQRFSYIMISGGKKNTNNLSVHASKILKRIILLAIESKILKLALDQNFNFESSPFTLLFFQNLIIYCILHSQTATSPQGVSFITEDLLHLMVCQLWLTFIITRVLQTMLAMHISKSFQLL